MKYEKSCGAVVFTRDGGAVKYVIVEELVGKYHGFPKGHVERNETELETARREISEEVSLDVQFIEGFRTDDEYFIYGGTVRKHVTYFLAEYTGQTPVFQKSELKSVVVVPFEEAMLLFEHDNTKRILTEANDYLRKLEVQKATPLN